MKFLRFLTAFLLVAVVFVDAHAQWNAVISSSGDDRLGALGSAPDDGGVVVAWVDAVEDELYARRYDAAGSIVWTTTVGSSNGWVAGESAQVLRQGNDYFVAWLDPISPRTLRVARLNSSGSLVTSTSLDSTIVTGATGLTMVPRTDGGVSVGWSKSNGAYARLYPSDLGSPVAAKFDVGGSIVGPLRLVDDQANGVIAVWSVHGGVSYEVRGSRVGPTGTKVWSGPLIEGTSGAQEIKAIGDQLGGAVVAAHMGFYVYVQHVDDVGNTNWDTSSYGRSVCTTCGYMSDPQIVLDSSEAAVVVSWTEVDPSNTWRTTSARKLLVGGGWAPEWGEPGSDESIDIVTEFSSVTSFHRTDSSTDERTIFVRATHSASLDEGAVDLRVVDRDGNVEFTTTLHTQDPLSSPIPSWDMPHIVEQSPGAYVPWRVLKDDESVDLRLSSWSPIFNVAESFDELHCRTNITWNTIPGSTANKFQYKRPVQSTWTTKNATGSAGDYSSFILQQGTSEYRILATVSGVAYTSEIYTSYHICDEPDPQGAPMAERRVTEVFMNAHPNPFNPVVTIDYGVTAQSFVSLAIFDISGRRVKTLVTELKPMGEHTATWYGDSDQGKPVASGVYFSRLTTNGKTVTHKLVMMK